MIKRLLLIFALIISAFNLHAQEWSTTLFGAKDGLPGSLCNYNGEEYYAYYSPQITPGTTFNKIRITVIETRGNESNNGNLFFDLAGLNVYDGNGSSIGYTASSNADHNSISSITDGGGLPALSDNNIESYFHSYWGSNYIGESHYIELTLDDYIDAFNLEWTTRLDHLKLAPTVVGITLGTDYTLPEMDFTLGNAITDVNDLNAQKQWFVLKSNATDEYLGNYANGAYPSYGCGELYISCAENGDKEATISHSMQLIPVENDRFIIYFPLNGKYLKNSAIDYDDVNGWQYSTTNIEEAAEIKLTPTGNGYFEMQYDGIDKYNNSKTLYIGADPRLNVKSRMKTFDFEHKQALENGDYTQGFSLPVNFNWTIYNAVVDAETIDEFSYSAFKTELERLNTTINNARIYLNKYGDFQSEGYYEYSSLNSIITSTENNIDNYTISEEIDAAITDIEATLSRYMFAKFKLYKKDIEDILNSVTFTEYPYKKDTYPSSSRRILESIINTVDIAETTPEAFQAEWYESMYIQIDNDINTFYSTKITEDSPTTDNNENLGSKEEIIEGEYVYLYLTNGGVEAYSREALDGDYYYSGSRIFFPLKGGEIEYYTKDEYIECSTTPPAMPTFASFKFNNKYNPTLFVDAIAEEITNEMTFSLNSIGKWLTASFTLSDEKAVAYVGNIQQESKVTKNDFSTPVTYHIGYPRYNRVERVKITQNTENEDTDITDEEIEEIPLSADAMYTNKPSTSSNEGLDNLLDNNSGTIFHSTHGSANNATLNVDAFITIALPYAVENIQIYYQCRNQNNYNPLEWEIYACNDGISWNLVRTLNYETDNMPTGGSSQEYTSPTINLGGNYSHIKILQTQGEYDKNHLAIAELRLYEVKPNTENVTPDENEDETVTYKNVRMPFGNKYTISIDWLTDRIAEVPRIDIDIDYGEYVTSKDYYLNANLKITGYGIYEDFEDSIQIKGRGNTSWGQSKKPYRLKFEEKVKPFGLTKGKSWVLLANAQKGSLMANAVSMKIGQMAGSQYTNHIVPVEVYMNGSYMGSYMFTEKVGLANNSVDVDEDTGYLLELDTYYDETYRFHTDEYNLPVNVKEPDLTEYSYEVANTRMTTIMDDMNSLCRALANDNNIEQHIDMDAFARFYLANDLSLNQEINHPKSTFLFNENENDANTKIKFGPIWDFDWGYGYENSGDYCYSGSKKDLIWTNYSSSGSVGYLFWQDLTKTDAFKKHYYKVWKEFIENNSIDELLEYIDSYYNFAKESFQNNINNIQGNRYSFTADDRDRLKSWIKERHDYIYQNIDKVNIDDLIYTMMGDASSNNQLTINDIAIVVAYMNGIRHSTFSNKNADCNENGYVDEDDINAIASLVMDSKAPKYSYWNSTKFAAGEFYSSKIDFEIHEPTTVKLGLKSDSRELYNAFQLEIDVPEGITISSINKGNAIQDYIFSCKEISYKTYRVIAYSDKSQTFNNRYDDIINIDFTVSEIMDEADRHIDIKNTYIVDNNNNELRIDKYSIEFEQTTSVKSIAEEILVTGGDYISITTLAPKEVAIYGIDGRKVHTVNCKNGTTRIAMPAGIYIVNGNKVTVK